MNIHSTSVYLTNPQRSTPYTEIHLNTAISFFPQNSPHTAPPTGMNTAVHKIYFLFPSSNFLFPLTKLSHMTQHCLDQSLVSSHFVIQKKAITETATAVTMNEYHQFRDNQSW